MTLTHTAPTATCTERCCSGPATLQRRRWFTVLAAMAAAQAGWGATHLAGIDLEVHRGDSTSTVGSVATTLTSLVAGLLAWALLVLLERRTARARSTWTRIACGVALLSLIGPLGATSASAMLVLAGLHALVATVVIVGMRRSTLTRAERPRTRPGHAVDGRRIVPQAPLDRSA